jgi:hypothetical protein
MQEFSRREWQKFAEMNFQEDLEVYWDTPEGREERTELIAETFTYRVVNGAIQALSK